MSPAFHVRNMQGNIFNMVLAGFSNPARFWDAHKLLKTRKQIADHINKTGDTFAEAAKKLGVSDETVQTLRHLRDHNVMRGGQFDDLFALPGEDVTFENLRKFSTVTKANPTMVSRDVGNYLEDTSRIALYLDQAGKGLDPQTAANVVKEFLFDYGDLTRFETDVRRTVSRFYTFMRKNTALQAKMLTEAPAIIKYESAIAEDISEAVGNYVTEAMTGEEGNSLAPPWVRAAAMSQLASGGYAGMDTPFLAAADSFAALTVVPVAAAETAGLIPPDVANLVVHGEGWPDHIGQATGVFSGLLPSVATYLVDEQSGVDSFTGRPHDKDPRSGFTRFLATLNPGVDRGFRLAEDVGKLGDLPDQFINQGYLERVRRDAERRGEDPDQAVEDALKKGEVSDKSSMWLNWLAGFRYYPAESARRNAYWTMDRALREMLEEAGNAPTLTELRDLGVIQMRNDVAYLLAYTPEEERHQALVDYIGEGQIEDLTGEVFPDKPVSSLDADEVESAQHNLKQRYLAWETYLGAPLSQNQRRDIAYMSSFAPTNSDMEALGVEPFRTGIRFLDSEDEQYNLAESGARLDLLAQWGGFSHRARQTDIQRAFEEGAKIGWTEQQVIQWIIENDLNRTETGVLMQQGILPEGSLSLTTDGSRSLRDAQREQTQAWELAALLTEIHVFRTGRLPSQAWVFDMVKMINMNKGDQEMLGGAVRGSIPNAKNVQSKYEQYLDAVSEQEDQRRGVMFGPHLGAYAPSEDSY